MSATTESVVANAPKQLFIGGEWVDGAGGKTLDVIDPSTGEEAVLSGPGRRARSGLWDRCGCRCDSLCATKVRAGCEPVGDRVGLRPHASRLSGRPPADLCRGW